MTLGMSAAALAGAPAAAAPTAPTAPTAPAAPAATAEVPKPLAARRGRLASRTVVTSPVIPLTHLSVAAAGAAAVRLRTAAGWGSWQELRGCAGGRDGMPAGPASGVVLATGATGYEVQVADGSAASVTELNMVDGPRRTVAAQAGHLPMPDGQSLPNFLSRSGWGADESLRFGEGGTEVWPGEFFPVQTITVHHTGVDEHNDDPDPAATIRAIYYDQCVLQAWGDIGYHLLIDEAGRVYEGRHSGPDPVPVFGSAPGTGQLAVNGGHVGGYNAGNIAVCLLGRFTSRQPSPLAQQSLVMVLVALSVLGRVNPTARTTYVNPVSGASGAVDVIPGHRDWASIGAAPTECPGDTFHPYLPAVREKVARLRSLGRPDKPRRGA
ncbi:peptidoglycan recognition family protein [Plantactinospora sp. WMMC1484]|uniref:peptidoglycan recognition protein family protein n=1 Tax=Plantactinospora sp. WMMC1484 TaxID=3404122 RepID=UPI003BF5C934